MSDRAAGGSEGAAPLHQGGCLCGAVRYRVAGPLRQALVCHCGMCQRTHGVPAAYSAADKQDLTLTESRGLKWYRSSGAARRGFCSECGASLFWDREAAGYVAIACGTIDAPTGVRIAGHIFVAEKGDYYEIADGLPQFEHGTGGRLPSAPSDA